MFLAGTNQLPFRVDTYNDTTELPDSNTTVFPLSGHMLYGNTGLVYLYQFVCYTILIEAAVGDHFLQKKQRRQFALASVSILILCMEQTTERK